ncbi:hypothetical protein VQ042_22400 [Aurantimonas sp. A2-1-M11]|uniref:hypothetical protein n=1 Tax=Aurantimonas sp. A2-1-M11 TaxID=3113712 RepID=UPI002F9574B1
MSTYGVQPTGFVRKNLATTLAELEQQMVTEFAPGVIQTPQSPFGQLNGLMADIITELWELAQDVYQSYDPDQAEGSRLDILGRIRLIRRNETESDSNLRQLITNDATARINLADLFRAVKNVPGVTFARVFVNETPEIDDLGLTPNTVAVAALGGDDDDIAEAINQFVIPGVSTYGNTELSFDDDGFCRALRMVRPIEVETVVTVRVRVSADRNGCPPPSSNAIREALYTFLTGIDTRPANGQAITPHFVRTFLEGLFSNVEVLSISGVKDGEPSTEGVGIPYSFFEIAQVTSVVVEVA